MSFLEKIKVEAGTVWVLLETSSKRDPLVSVYKNEQAADKALKQRETNLKSDDPGNRREARFYLLKSELT